MPVCFLTVKYAGNISLARAGDSGGSCVLGPFEWDNIVYVLRHENSGGTAGGAASTHRRISRDRLLDANPRCMQTSYRENMSRMMWDVQFCNGNVWTIVVYL